MSKRLSKEELESDPLIETYNKTVAFFIENKTVILTAIIGVVVIIGTLIGYNYYSSQQEQRAQQLLATAENYYSEGDYDRALNGDNFELTYGYAQISDEFSGTDAGNMATYYAAVCSFEIGNIDQAIAYFEEYKVPRGILGVGPLSFYANILNDNGNYDRAGNAYLKAAEWDVNDSTTPFNLLKAAESYFEAENYEDALQVVNRIISEYPNSTEFAPSQKLKGMIAAKS